MATYKIPKPRLRPDEFVFRCPHCYVYLVKTIDFYGNNVKATYDFCPECSGKI